MTKTRCSWAGPDEIYIKYHDEEWGIPTHDDRVTGKAKSVSFWKMRA